MQDEKFEQWLREASQSYNRPPKADVEQMWSAIEAGHVMPQRSDIVPLRPRWYANSWLRVAAALVIGVGVGRMTMDAPPFSPPVASNNVAAATTGNGQQQGTVTSDPATLRYIGQTVALLASFESDVSAPRSDTAVAARAKELLLTTRLLLDAQQASDPIVYALLEDLELVLVQIVQMPPKRNPSDVDLIKEAMQQRDVMPRLIAAATNTTSAE
jgi:hypothetical protein